MTVKKLIELLSKQDQNKFVISYNKENNDIEIKYVYDHGDVVVIHDEPKTGSLVEEENS